MAAATEAKAGVVEKHGKKKKEKPPKMTHVIVENGTLTVDGWTGKAELNYDITNLQYLYFYAPGVGTAVVSNVSFPGAREQKDAFNENTLSFSVDGHAFELSSEKRLLSKKPEAAWVRLDKGFQADAKYPVMGYGAALAAPYVWPGAQPMSARVAGSVAAPPLPSGFRPKLISAPCYTSAGLPCASPTTAAAPAQAPTRAPGVQETAPGGVPAQTNDGSPPQR